MLLRGMTEGFFLLFVAPSSHQLFFSGVGGGTKEFQIPPSLMRRREHRGGVRMWECVRGGGFRGKRSSGKGSLGVALVRRPNEDEKKRDKKKSEEV